MILPTSRLYHQSPHHESAVWQRALRGDKTVIEYVLAKLNSDHHWFQVVPHVWENEFEATIDAALTQVLADPDRKERSSSDQHFELGQLIRDIPAEAAERLLVKHWGGLSQLPLFIQAALYHGTQQCRNLAAAGMRCRTRRPIDGKGSGSASSVPHILIIS